MHSEQQPDMKGPSWGKLSPCDWNTIGGSILLALTSDPSGVHFGRERLKLEMLRTELSPWFFPSNMMSMSAFYNEQSRLDQCRSGKYVSGVFTPNNEAEYALVMQIETSESLSDTAHWGHLAWKLASSCSVTVARTHPMKKWWTSDCLSLLGPRVLVGKKGVGYQRYHVRKPLIALCAEGAS
mmetsp:Transcript_21275/g.49065  ORF Transcript_21275/g.49065 Transcript_21275/m.49065 type:complete len:182 (-) Transcript_21275:76-621(-)